MAMYTEFLQSLDSRERVSVGSLERGAYCKLGSNCLLITRKHKARVEANRIDTNGNEYPFALALDNSLSVIPLTRADVDQAIELRKTEDVKPYSPFDGLEQALAGYLSAEREKTANG